MSKYGITKCKKEFLLDEQIDFSKDPNKFWQSISRVIPNKKDSDGNTCLNDEKVPEIDSLIRPIISIILFTNIGKNLENKIEPTDWNYLDKNTVALINR